MGERQKFIVLAVDADFTIYGTNKTRIAYRFSLLIQTTNNCGIQTILGAQRRRKIALDRPHNHHTGIEIGMLV